MSRKPGSIHTHIDITNSDTHSYTDLRTAIRDGFHMPQMGHVARAIAPLCHNPEQFGAKLIRGGGQHSFGLDAALARGAEAKEVHQDVSDDGKVVGGEAGAHGGLVFVELHVEAPVESVLHFPMAAHRMSNALGVSRQRTDVVASLATGLGADGSFSLDDGEALQIQPLLGLIETIHGIERPAAAHFGTPVAAVASLVPGTRRQRAPHAGLGEHNGVDDAWGGCL